MECYHPGRLQNPTDVKAATSMYEIVESKNVSSSRLKSDQAWRRFWRSMLVLKGALTHDEPFDFVDWADHGPALLVGEGNLSFALSLARRVKQPRRSLVATTFEPERKLSVVARFNAKRLRDLGVSALHGIDATKLSDHFGRTRFRLIAFQFPNVASRRPLYERNPNFVLVRRFLRSAAVSLSENGCIAITVVNSPHYDGAFAMSDAAIWAGISKPHIHPFHVDDHPGYRHGDTEDDGESAISAKDDCQTYVFSKPADGK